MEEQNQQGQQDQQSQSGQTSASQPEAPKADPADVEKNKAMAIVGYIVPLLFFVPLLSEAKNSPFAKFHANQQLNLLLAAVAVNVAGSIIPFIGWFIILPFGYIALVVFLVLGVVHAAKGEMKKLPLIGEIKLIS